MDSKNSQNGFVPLKSSVSHIGRRIKSSKIHFSWEFLIQDAPYKIDLFVSRMSGKRRIFLNGISKMERKCQSMILANYSLKIAKCHVHMIEVNENEFQLKINNQCFETELKLANHLADLPPEKKLKEKSVSAGCKKAKENYVSKKDFQKLENKELGKPSEVALVDLLDFNVIEPATEIQKERKGSNPFDDLLLNESKKVEEEKQAGPGGTQMLNPHQALYTNTVPMYTGMNPGYAYPYPQPGYFMYFTQNMPYSMPK